jgi:hypothetical protein
VNDGRPNGELLLSTGTLQDGNMSDCLYFPASLIPADRCGGGGGAGSHQQQLSELSLQPGILCCSLLATKYG